MTFSILANITARTGHGQLIHSRNSRMIVQMSIRSINTIPRPRPTLHPSQSALTPPHLLTLADLSLPQIESLVLSAIKFKNQITLTEIPTPARKKLIKSAKPIKVDSKLALTSLKGKTVALMFNKRSTRTRVASETAVKILGGHPMFLGSGDIQLGVNESLYDTSRVVSSMVDGIMARVGDHADVVALATHSSVPVINALSSLYHPTQILADLQTLLEVRSPFSPSLKSLQGMTIAWIGDSNNILNEMMVTYPRMGVTLQIATPEGYTLDEGVVQRAQEGIAAEGSTGRIIHTHSPEEALQGADVVTTDTWISMGQEEETARRMQDFAGFQITNDLLQRGGAKEDCLFMHCLPRHSYEVDDEVFYGDKSVVFQEAENRKWTILAVFDAFIGKWKV